MYNHYKNVKTAERSVPFFCKNSHDPKKMFEFFRKSTLNQKHGNPRNFSSYEKIDEELIVINISILRGTKRSVILEARYFSLDYIGYKILI